MVPKHSAVQGLYTGQAVMYIMEKICMLHKFRAGRSSSVVGCEFHGNKPAVCIKQGVFRQRDT